MPVPGVFGAPASPASHRVMATATATSTANAELEAIAELVPAARAAGFTKVEIAELGAISPPTLDELLRHG